LKAQHLRAEKARTLESVKLIFADTKTDPPLKFIPDTPLIDIIAAAEQEDAPTDLLYLGPWFSAWIKNAKGIVDKK
jgi:hypothetical protein